ncbi:MULTISPECIES: hypothetical protein [unclassified Neorhizobium]|uniref:hypothetical protein n=1 Tax=unclassified Neorhizobium TaxID=2629175 RepID=UPI001FF18184|nr:MULTISPECIES: hypothetical protein [unclassified Neorhizobium]MCJ9668531.1 hypothetical protein [Neorhizobium sp. SHOUNA12B]MCJ9744234.1 hypothetical protein [Neorhizobium sp. SHOUNA12A]
MKRLPRTEEKKPPPGDHFHLAVGDKLLVSIQGRLPIAAAFLLIVFFADDIVGWFR